jgi:hypothetical protein
MVAQLLVMLHPRGQSRRIGSLPSQPTAASRTASKIRRRVGVSSAISITVPGWPSWGFAPLADRPAVLDRPIEQFVIVHRPARPVLQALVPSGEKIAIHARRPVPLLDQLELHLAGIGQRYGNLDVVGLLFVPKPSSGNFSATNQGPTPQTEIQCCIAPSMSRTTKPICRSGPNKRLITIPPL